MLSKRLYELINSYEDFPIKGIVFRDLMPVFLEPKVYGELIENMSSQKIFKDADAIISIESRGFLVGSGIALATKKPMITARKPEKLPGKLISQSFSLEYGSNSLSIQESSLNQYESFAIVDDLLATGGTAEAVCKIIESLGKKVTGISVVIELNSLNGRAKLKAPVASIIKY